MKNLALLAVALVSTACIAITTADEPQPIGDKTLVAWASPDTLDQSGGSILTIDDKRGGFDAIVFAECGPKRWMAGSENYRRTDRKQDAWPQESAGPGEFVQIAIVYRGKKIELYRDGQPYASYTIDEPRRFDPGAFAVFGRRHLVGGGDAFFRGEIDDARIYGTALVPSQIVALKPNEPSDIQPWAWWTFDGPADETGRFPHALLVNQAKLVDGRLQLKRSGDMMVAGPEAVTTELLDKLMKNNPRRQPPLPEGLKPIYHITSPEPRNMPFDPNGAVFRNGRYHLWFIFQDDRGHCWGHLSSTDMLHWTRHAEDLSAVGGPETGIFSGNCFIDTNGDAVICYHGCGKGNCMAICKAEDKNLDHWTKCKANPVTTKPAWDPHAWVEGDAYYQISGGNPPSLYRGKNYEQWELVGEFMKHDMPGVDSFEDVSCPDFFKLGDKYMLLCISHPRGCRYYLGRWENEQFIPEQHHRMNWPGGTFFAPESLLDDQGRRIMWAWVLGGNGFMSLPRVLTLGEDGNLDINPIAELDTLRHDEKTLEPFTLEAGKETTLEGIRGRHIELDVVIDPGTTQRFGLKVRCADDDSEYTPIVLDREKNIVSIDMRPSSLTPHTYNSFVMFRERKEAPTLDAPLVIADGEKVNLRVYIDGGMIEVFVNDQAVTQMIYPTREDSLGVRIHAEDGPIQVEKVQAWAMTPTTIK